MLGGLVSALAFPLNSTWVFWAGIVVIVLGLVAGKVLAMMGFGVDGAGPLESAHRHRPPRLHRLWRQGLRHPDATPHRRVIVAVPR